MEATNHNVYASGIPDTYNTLNTLPNQWPGQNRLGIILMEVRDMIIDEQNTDLSPDINTNSNSLDTDTNSNAEDINTDMVAKASTPKMPTTSATSQESETIDDIVSDIDAVAQSLHDQIVEEGECMSVILGDSIVAGAACSNGYHISADSGNKLSSMSEVLNKAQDNVGNVTVDNCVIALGINDLRETKSVGATIRRLNDAVQKVQTSFPETRILLSAVLPCKSNKGNNKDLNSQIADYNNYLRDSAHDDKITFIGNCNSFKSNDHKGYYQNKDNSGIHLTGPGKAALVTIIEEAVDKIKSETRRKRNRAISETPPSAQKDQKSRRCDKTK